MVLVKKCRYSGSDNCSGPHWMNAQSNGALHHIVSEELTEGNIISLSLCLPQKGEELRVPEQPFARVHIR